MQNRGNKCLSVKHVVYLFNEARHFSSKRAFFSCKHKTSHDWFVLQLKVDWLSGFVFRTEEGLNQAETPSTTEQEYHVFMLKLLFSYSIYVSGCGKKSLFHHSKRIELQAAFKFRCNREKLMAHYCGSINGVFCHPSTTCTTHVEPVVVVRS